MYLDCRSGWYINADELIAHDLLTEDNNDEILNTDGEFHVLEPFDYAVVWLPAITYI